ncbi:hypothetical protein CBL_10987 [Carabus blaptoides fortunei]
METLALSVLAPQLNACGGTWVTTDVINPHEMSSDTAPSQRKQCQRQHGACRSRDNMQYTFIQASMIHITSVSGCFNTSTLKRPLVTSSDFTRDGTALEMPNLLCMDNVLTFRPVVLSSLAFATHTTITGVCKPCACFPSYSLVGIIHRVRSLTEWKSSFDDTTEYAKAFNDNLPSDTNSIAAQALQHGLHPTKVYQSHLVFHIGNTKDQSSGIKLTARYSPPPLLVPIVLVFTKGHKSDQKDCKIKRGRGFYEANVTTMVIRRVGDERGIVRIAPPLIYPGRIAHTVAYVNVPRGTIRSEGNTTCALNSMASQSRARKVFLAQMMKKSLRILVSWNNTGVLVLLVKDNIYASVSQRAKRYSSKQHSVRLAKQKLERMTVKIEGV